MASPESLSTDPYKGVRDFYPEDWALLQAVFDRARTTLRTYGFEEYQASPLERAELYERKTSEEIVAEQTYTFTDRGDRKVTLRPEMTPTLARMIAGRRRELVYPCRWFSIGNRFRYERPQKGRLREFYQIDVDIVGSEGVDAELEIVQLAHALFSSFGAQESDFVIKVNSRALLNAACTASGLNEEEATAYLGLLDRMNKLSPEAFEEARAPYRKNGNDPLECIQAKEDAQVVAEYEALSLLIQNWHKEGMTNVVFDPSVVRGFLYYTGLVFEVFDTNPENPRALMGGGRYDGLMSLFGVDALPAVGFALGDVTLLDFLRSHNLLPASSSAPTVCVGVPSPEDRVHAKRYADALRSRGISTVVYAGKKGLGDQVKEAVRRHIPFFVAYGAAEVEAPTLTLKTLNESREDVLSPEEVLIRVKG